MSEYIEAKEATKEIIEECITKLKYTIKQSIPATLEDSVMAMVDDDSIYVSVFLNLGIVSMSHGFLPDYIFSRIDKIKSIKLELSDEDLNQYQKDLDEFNALLESKKFKIDENLEYMERVDLILEE